MEVLTKTAAATAFMDGVGGESHAVKVSTSAEFMMAIAYGIYSDTLLAFVRETICNARDGHIKAGCPNKPIDITLTETGYTIRDYGTGIPFDKLPDIYLTYGESTKRDSAGETGGFGVGSKVPWAICNEFYIRVFLDGQVATFVALKSDPDLGGKPSCREVMRVPTTEPNGISVSVPLQPKDASELGRYIRNYASYLALPINFKHTVGKEVHHDKLVPARIDYTTLQKDGFILHSTDQCGEGIFAKATTFPKVSMRLGDVLYPVDRDEAYAEQYDVLTMLTPGFRVILEGIPNEVSPAMPRESLSNNEMTLQGIKRAFNRAIQFYADRIDAFNDSKIERIREVVTRKFILNNLYTLQHNKIEVGNRAISAAEIINDRYQQGLNLNFTYMYQRRGTRLESAKWTTASVISVVNEIIEEAYEEVRKDPRALDFQGAPTFWQKAIYLQPLTTSKAIAEFMGASLNFSRLSGSWVEFTHSHLEKITFPRMAQSTEEVALKAYDLAVKNTIRTLEKREDYLYHNKIVIVCNKLTMVKDRLRHWGENNPDVYDDLLAASWTNSRQEILNYAPFVRLPAGKPEKTYQEFMQKFREEIGDKFHIIDLTQPCPHEFKVEEEPNDVPIEKEPLLNLFEDKLYRYDSMYPKHNRTSKGKFFFIADRGLSVPNTMLTDVNHRRLMKYLGHDIVIVSNKADIRRALKEGRVDIDAVLAREFEKFLKLNPKLYLREAAIKAVGGPYRPYKLLKHYIPQYVPIKGTRSKELHFFRLMADIGSMTLLREKVYLFNKMVADTTYQPFRPLEKYLEDRFYDYQAVLHAAANRSHPKNRDANRILRTYRKEML